MEASSDKDAVARPGKRIFQCSNCSRCLYLSSDQGGKVVYGNEAFAELVGVKKERLRGPRLYR